MRYFVAGAVVHGALMPESLMMLTKMDRGRLSEKCLTKGTFFAAPGTCGKHRNSLL